MDNTENKKEKTGSYWEEVGAQFTAFGESLGEALRATIEDPKAHEALEQIKTGLHQAADEIDEAIHTAKEDPKVKQFTEEANQVLNKFGEVGEETVQKARPHVVKALKSFTDALNRLIEDMEEE